MRTLAHRRTRTGTAHAGLDWVPILFLCLMARAGADVVPPARGTSPLEATVLRAVRAAHFEEVVDFGAGNEDRDAQPGTVRRVAHMPNVDVAVIQFDETGHAVASANVLLSRDYPDGLVVPVTPDSGAAAVRFRRWEIDRWNGGVFPSGASTAVSHKGWTNDPPLTPEDDLMPGREAAPYPFMAPYPASLFKLLIAVQALRWAEEVKFDWTRPLTLTAGAEATPVAVPPATETRSLEEWLDRMITASDNLATQVLLVWLHRLGQVEVLNQSLRRWGLGTLQVKATRPEDGRGWQTDLIRMTAYDTARLLWLIDGPPGTLWRSPEGTPVTARILSDATRRRLHRMLEEQGLNEALTTANLAGAPNVSPGLPSAVPERWIDPMTGTVTVDGIRFGIDVRPANRLAQVRFAHKTGLTYNYASDAGIVRSLPGQPFRHYVIAFLSNLGYRYADPVFAGRTRGPYADPVAPISYTQRIPALAREIDQALIELSRKRPPAHRVGS